MRSVIVASLVLGQALAADRTLGFKAKPTVENRTLDEIYKAALAEGGVVTLWHGGDEPDQLKPLQDTFEGRFPGMKLNVTVDLSKYFGGRIDQQLANNNVHVDNVMLQTVHDFPRWAREDALLNYAPLGFDQVHPALKDSLSGSWYAVEIIFWKNIWSTKKLPGAKFDSFQSFLDPEYKDKLVLTYPSDDDAVLFAFDQIMQDHGVAWFDKLLAQNPTWVRGTETPLTLISQPNNSLAATFTTSIGFADIPDIATAFPNDGLFTSWGQRGAILKDAPHPEGAKLLASFMLSSEFQDSMGWSVLQDVEPPAGLPQIMRMNNTNVVAFNYWMEDRANVERLRLFFEDRIGTSQGKSPLLDDI
ncbi:ABC-type Fe3+ transport system [Metarhizium album ARSEF 1941]|uniref:ABC-type Fe3+ transport system n=1 Tax=Metarhizium album (strain ARSEF 1941) TaxID=1081103 RepID=A0A0B2WRS5_METAS|nr:ABC-type Fe3+ transport system [Metarhizium album ARSEF 1941]KHN96202.1 ABC-type Fe3+ transport system [Metarhizium album ARSEF 1941]